MKKKIIIEHDFVVHAVYTELPTPTDIERYVHFLSTYTDCGRVFDFRDDLIFPPFLIISPTNNSPNLAVVKTLFST